MKSTWFLLLAVLLTACGPTVASAPTIAPQLNLSVEPSALPTETNSPPPIGIGGGGRIAFEVRLGDNSPKLHTVNSDGSDMQDVAGLTGFLAAWSPNGMQIVYVAAGNSGRNDLFIVDADGSNMRRLTNTPKEEGIPAWSPDGRNIAISINLDGDAEIYLLDVESGEVVRQLTDNDKIDDYMPAWSPDGSQIAYVTSTGSPESNEIHLMDGDGGNRRQLSDNDALDYYPAWSPDSNQIAFVSERDGNEEIYLMDAEGSNIRRLTDSSDLDSKPVWSPDGTVIAFHSRLDGDFSIYLVEVETGEVWLLIESGVHPSWSANNQNE